jgi:hypothetical protein
LLSLVPVELAGADADGCGDSQDIFAKKTRAALDISISQSLKVLSDENQGGSKVVSIASSFFTV